MTTQNLYFQRERVRESASVRARLRCLVAAMKVDPYDRDLWHQAEEIRQVLAEIDRRYSPAWKEVDA